MSFNAPTLPSLMAMLPCLHPLHLAREKLSTLKQLRLVNKDVSSLVQTAVQSCTVHLGGDTSSLNTQHCWQRLGMLTAGAQLQNMTVVVIVSSGETVISFW